MDPNGKSRKFQKDFEGTHLVHEERRWKGGGGHTQKGRGWASDAYALYAVFHEQVQNEREMHAKVEEKLKLRWCRLKEQEDEAKPKKRKERNPELDKVIAISREEDLSCGGDDDHAGLWAIAMERVVKQEEKKEEVVKQEEEEEEEDSEEEEEDEEQGGQ